MKSVVEIEIPETWDKIKYTKPIYPTYSRGKMGKSLYCNNKFHCYGVVHSNPIYNLTPYKPKGFGFAEKNRSYLPLTHVQDRSHPKPSKTIYEKPRMKQIYENSIDALRANADLGREKFYNNIRRNNENCRNFPLKFQYETKNLSNETNEMIGGVKYRTHLINRTLRNYHDSMRS
jgi:hypothetical protein